MKPDDDDDPEEPSRLTRLLMRDQAERLIRRITLLDRLFTGAIGVAGMFALMFGLSELNSREYAAGSLLLFFGFLLLRNAILHVRLR